MKKLISLLIVFNLALQLLFVASNVSAETVEAFVANNCRACQQLEFELNAGKFAKLQGVTWELHNVSLEGMPAGFPGAPCFRIKGTQEFLLVDPYSGQKVYNMLYDRLVERADAANPQRHIGKLEYRPDRPDEVAAGPQQLRPVPDPRFTPAAKSKPLVDIDWTGVRFGVLVSNQAPTSLHYLSGVVQKLLDAISGGQCVLEAIDEKTQPRRYSACCTALQVDAFEIYPFMTIDKVADVNFVRGLILKKMEAAVDSKIHAEEHQIIPDMIFRRVSQNKWARVVNAMDVVDAVGSGASVPVRPKVTQEIEEEEPAEKKQSHSVIAFIFAALAASKVIRVTRHLWKGSQDKLLDQIETTVESRAAISQPVVVTARAEPAAVTPHPAASPTVQPLAQPAAVQARPAVVQPVHHVPAGPPPAVSQPVPPATQLPGSQEVRK